MSYIYNNNNTNILLDNDIKNYKQRPDSNVIDSIDKRLEMLEKQKEEIQKKFGIDEALLNAININNNQINLPNHLMRKTNKPKREGYENLTKIEVFPKINEKYSNNYKTPEKLIDSLKYEPNINDLITEEEFVPKFSNFQESKSKNINPPTCDILYYIDDVINNDFLNDVLH